MDANYSPELEKQVVAWIKNMVGEEPAEEGREGLYIFLKNGVVLLKLLNAIQPGTFAEINESEMPFKSMGRIGNFLNWIETYGVPKTDSFHTADLYENQNMAKVLITIQQLDSIYRFKNSDEKPSAGSAGGNVIGLQMGSNKGASQIGGTPFGLGRQIEKTNLDA